MKQSQRKLNHSLEMCLLAADFNQKFNERRRKRKFIYDFQTQVCIYLYIYAVYITGVSIPKKTLSMAFNTLLLCNCSIIVFIVIFDTGNYGIGKKHNHPTLCLVNVSVHDITTVLWI